MTVLELFQATAPHLDAKEDKPPLMPIMKCVNSISSALTKHLWKMKSDLLIPTVATVNLRANVDPAIANLPSEFLGLASEPFIYGTDEMLTQADSYSLKNYIGESGDPLHYRIRGGKFQVWPYPTTATKIEIEYFKGLSLVESLGDDLPETPLFDDIYSAGVIKFAPLGYIPLYEPEFVEMLKTAVNDVVSARREVKADFVTNSY